MTSISPDEVYYTYEAWAIVDGDQLHLPVTNIIASMDRDRVPYVMATLECGEIDLATFLALDPRDSDVYPDIYWNIRQWTDIGGVATEIGRLPYDYVGATDANMYVRTITRDLVNATTIIELAGGESYMMDKRRLSGATLDTGAAFVSSLVEWSLIDVFGSYVISHAGVVLSTAIPAGDRRLMNPGESHLDLVQPELDALDCRLIGEWRLGDWKTIVRTAETGVMELATYTDGPVDADPIVYEMTETVTRDSDFADGVLVKYDNTDAGGTITWQRSGSGVNTRGLVIERQRVEPAANAADSIVTRTLTRGYDLNILARIRFDIDAYYTLEVHIPDEARTVRVRSVEWNIAEGTMAIRGQAGEPEE